MSYDPETMDNLGILPGINEVIVTTEMDGRANAAPMGIIRNDIITARLFLGTHTYSNILATGTLVANVCHDPVIFVQAAMAELNPEHFIREDDVLILREAEAWALFRCQTYRADILMPELEFVKGRVVKVGLRSINRGLAGVIEAAVAATRYQALKVDSYLEDIRKIKKIIHRCGGPRDIEAMDLLESYLDEL
ncbi:MAG: hypothetical protein A4E45_01225 [Methanosaeta sp. PtaB.Bin039]|nr:MAG: hypothetical protein A4E45_01225 [Methanosaeta sp. PtaB.Bin039]OPY46764.1 MAG: hypothetical protein A4E47_00481 [Methanosaeta sp. PtaU1.Bin028]HOT07110.1 DUF447 family protein [Methanotrichaceae archaeon]HQF17054.1 DUF447 family protein [Methanotrichaceae archaeon]HQI91675.1 DUF447 family protein [Methanotrichaceae archaeon]